ncbi:unnamed protein product [Effrenium voratum]|uniref:Uncharacterized protein n=1 Tax=Effrenium voratum TaxID=2562239 RepID=A0AA36I3R1_9DINO|nr:unnamed protein product [Effrenium voratum]CAJ1438805.1 unnamed protein product [Effrenium voratum]CAJ1462073.1 unnamed protein product [Effrenium voratum]
MALRLAVICELVLLGSAALIRGSNQQQEESQDGVFFPKTVLGDGKSVVGVDVDGRTQMLVQVKVAASYVDACDDVVCGDLKCPAGFTATKYEGHCCPYCVNPDIKIEPKIVGATGKWGAEMSAFCPYVWCFPTLCEKELVMPTSDNGQCCPMCPK